MSGILPRSDYRTIRLDRITVAVSLLVGLTVLVGCGSSSGSSGKASSSGSAAAAAAPAVPVLTANISAAGDITGLPPSVAAGTYKVTENGAGAEHSLQLVKLAPATPSPSCSTT